MKEIKIYSSHGRSEMGGPMIRGTYIQPGEYCAEVDELMLRKVLKSNISSVFRVKKKGEKFIVDGRYVIEAIAPDTINDFLLATKFELG